MNIIWYVLKSIVIKLDIKMKLKCKDIRIMKLKLGNCWEEMKKNVKVNNIDVIDYFKRYKKRRI